MASMRHTVNTVLSRATGYHLTRQPGRGPSQGTGEPVAGLKRRLAEAEAKVERLERAQVVRAQRAEENLERLGQTPLPDLSLTDIANLHGTDKGTMGPGQDWLAHNYTDVYEAYLSPLRHEPITLLEVGLGVPGDAWEARIARGRNATGGASLRMWHDYFPKARIYGADINPASHLDNDRITTYVVDQGDPDALHGMLDAMGDVEPDVIVDDGSHRPDHQQITLGCLFPRLRPGGLYIIEDLLRNGRGDEHNQGRMASDSVLNTRRVLKHFRTHGTFEGPHAIGAPDELAATIDQVNFHVRNRRWEDDTERVCVIRKRG